MVKIFQILILIAICSLCSCNQSDIPLYRIQENGLFGFIDSTGTIIIKPQYKYVSNYNSYGYATIITEYSEITKKGALNDIDTLLHIKYGIIDKNNSLVVDTIHTIELSSLQLSQIGIQRIYKTNISNYSKGTLKFNDIIDEHFIQLRAGFHVVQNPKTKLMGYMNLKKDTCIKANYVLCRPFYGGIASVNIERNSEFISTDDFMKNLNSNILIDSLGNVLTKDEYFTIPKFNHIDYSWAGKLISREDGTPEFIWLLLDKTGKVCSDTLKCTKVYNSQSDYYVFVQNFFGTPIYSFVDKSGKVMPDFDHDGFIDFFFDDVKSFSDTIAGVKVRYGENLCWTFVNKKFEFISQPFDSLSYFSEGLVAVKEFSSDKITSKWGFVDKKFKEAIPYKYDKVGAFIDGLAYFNLGNIEGYINKSGRVIWKHTMK